MHAAAPPQTEIGAAARGARGRPAQGVRLHVQWPKETVVRCGRGREKEGCREGRTQRIPSTAAMSYAEVPPGSAQLVKLSTTNGFNDYLYSSCWLPTACN